jgi:putative endonuclease
MGELDLVAMDGKTLVIVEVKAHRSSNRAGPPAPALAVGPQKQRRLRRLADAWLMTRLQGRPFEDLRFDVVGITYSPGGRITGYEHLEDAF